MKILQKLVPKIFPLTKTEQRKYVMLKGEDYEILKRVKQLEKLKLTKEDKKVVGLIKTQLKSEWRKPLIRKLNQLFKKYSKE